MVDLNEIERRLSEYRDNPLSVLDEVESPSMIIVKKFYQQIQNLRRDGLSMTQVSKLVAPKINMKTFCGAFYRFEKKQKQSERKAAAAERRKADAKPSSSAAPARQHRPEGTAKPATLPPGMVPQNTVDDL